jgi:hypothetical protein
MLHAQFESERETRTYSYSTNPDISYDIDTGIHNLEEYNFLQKEGWEFWGLGNVGLAHRPMTLNWDYKKGFKSGMRNFDRYKFSRDKIKYYNIEKPLSEIYYSIGSNREHIFKGSHAQNIKNRFEYGIDFNRISSLGTYQNQQTRNAGFSMYTKYSSKNNRYHLDVDLALSQIKAEENGGLIADIVNPTVPGVFNPQLYPTYLSDGITTHNNLQVLMTNSYDFGFFKIDSVSDSLAVRKFYPVFRISHSFGTGKNTFGFKDKSPDENYYGDFFQISDSVYYQLYYHEIPHSVSFKYLGAKNGDSVTYHNLTFEAGIQHDNIELWQNLYEITTNNLHVFGSLGSNPKNKSSFRYGAKTYYYMTGYNQNDFHVSGKLAYHFEKFGNISGGLIFENVAPDWIENNYFSRSLTWDNNFSKKRNLEISADYTLPKYRFKTHFQYNLIDNFTYFNEQSRPEQLGEVLSYWMFSAQKEMRWRILNFDNFVGVQGVSNEGVLRVPTLFVKSSFYLEGKIFKGNMLARLGIDMRYNTDIYADAWNPLIGQFYIQNEKEIRFVPVFDFFINFKVKTLRVFIKSNYISQGLMARNYYTALNYPDKGRTFAGGLVWRFFE